MRQLIPFVLVLVPAVASGQMIRLDSDPLAKKAKEAREKQPQPATKPKTVTVTVYDPDPNYSPKLGDVAFVYDRNGNAVMGAKSLADADQMASFVRSGDRLGLRLMSSKMQVILVPSGSKVLVNEVFSIPHGTDAVRRELSEFVEVRVLDGPMAGAICDVFRMSLTRPVPRQVEVLKRRR